MYNRWLSATIGSLSHVLERVLGDRGPIILRALGVLGFVVSSPFKPLFIVSSIVVCKGRVGHVHQVPVRAYHRANATTHLFNFSTPPLQQQSPEPRRQRKATKRNICLGGVVGQLLPDPKVSQKNIKLHQAAYGQDKSQGGLPKFKVSHHPP